MFSPSRRTPFTGSQVEEQDFDPLITRIRRLAAHRGYERNALISPMLKRLMSPKHSAGDPASEIAELRKRIREAQIDRRALTYLTESVETELDFARLRLT